MGATPAWFLCAIALPKETSPAYLRRLAKGMARLARQAGIGLVGGNFTAARELSIAITAAGEVPRGSALTRGGARPGDVLYVSGELGEARLGLERLLSGAARRAHLRQRRPTARLSLGRLARRFASGAIDLSDGLGQDLAHLCARSGVGAEVWLAALPLARSVRRAKGDGAAWFAARGGEDYELLLSVPAASARGFERACARAGERVTKVGTITSGRAPRFLDLHGVAVEAPPGFDHFG
jgi:thiamine-monophosphate kinase